MQCIACGMDNIQLAKSHVIPNFIRKKLTGEETSCGNKKFQFNWVERPELPKQDLPKPFLMCKKCDNNFGAVIEREASKLLMPEDTDNWDDWEKLPIFPKELYLIFDTPLKVGVYDYSLEREQEFLNKFAMLTAWRALHFMAREKTPLSVKFLELGRGVQMDLAVRDYLISTESAPHSLPAAELYFLGPKTAAMTTGRDDEMPFAWAELGDEELLGIGVTFAFWVILWPVFEPINDHKKLTRLEELCFKNWRQQMIYQLRS